MLEVRGVEARYGAAPVLRGISFAVAPGRNTVLLGRNGAGKSTTIKAVMGLVPPTAGSVRFRGREVAGAPAFQIARLGVGYVPEEQRIFTDLSVLENLQAGARPVPGGWTTERLFELFPNLGPLRHRSAARMSGGEQQMLAVARTLMGNPALLLLDEPSEGLSPLIAEQLAAALLRLRGNGTTVLLAEQNLRFARHLADDAVVLERGAVAWSGTVAALDADPALQARYMALAVTAGGS